MHDCEVPALYKRTGHAIRGASYEQHKRSISEWLRLQTGAKRKVARAVAYLRCAMHGAQTMSTPRAWTLIIGGIRRQFVITWYRATPSPACSEEGSPLALTMRRVALAMLVECSILFECGPFLSVLASRDLNRCNASKMAEGGARLVELI